MKRPTNWEIIALLSMGYKAKDIIKFGYSSTAYKYERQLEEARKTVKTNIIKQVKK